MIQNKLYIYDISHLVYVGTTSSHTAQTVRGLPCGGFIFALEKILTHLSSGYSVALAFDAGCDKKMLDPDYKATRVADMNVAIQIRMLWDMGHQIGLPMFKQEGFEADEIIYNLMRQNNVCYNTIDIYTNDADIYGNIWKPGVRCIGSGLHGKLIDTNNYEVAIRAGEYIPYNTVLPYICMHGKQSNNLRPLQLETPVEPDRMYRDFIQFADDQQIPPEQRSEEKYIKRWLLSKVSQIPKADFEKIKQRIAIVYPRIISDIDFQVSYECSRRYNEDALVRVLRIFGMKAPAMNFNVLARVNSVLDKEESDIRTILRYKTMLESGDILSAAEESHYSVESCDTMENTSVFTIPDFEC